MDLDRSKPAHRTTRRRFLHPRARSNTATRLRCGSTPTTRLNIEELSGMNLFAVIGEELHTPILNESILPGVTRVSLIVVARDAGWRVVERAMPDRLDLLRQLSTVGECRRGCLPAGTAAIVVSDQRRHR